MFDNHNDIFFRPFTVKFKVADTKNPALGTSSITILYDSITSGISSTPHPGERGEDFIR
jgi:hypothetical protein